MNVQEATLDDLKILAVHHRKMFEEIWEQKRLNNASGLRAHPIFRQRGVKVMGFG